MKIGEALLEKTKLKRKLADLQTRLTQCLFRTKLGDETIDEPDDVYPVLEEQYIKTVNDYHSLNSKIQKANSRSATLEVMAQIASQSAIAQTLEGVLNSCSQNSYMRVGRTKEDSYTECVVGTKELRQRIEDLKNNVLDLNSKLNALNWSTDL